jgi:hypothetical protein
MSTIERPKYSVMDLKDALAWHWRGWHLSQKYDGRFAVRELADSIVTGEAMRSGKFFAWDIPVFFGEDIQRQPWREREQALTELFSRLHPMLNWHRCASGTGAEFIEAVLARGGEGVVAKPWDSPFGRNWIKVKKSETFDCLITEKHPTKMSVHLSVNGEDAGWCAAFSTFEQIQIGDVVEVEAFCRNPSGKFREPRILRIRTDKMEAMI